MQIADQFIMKQRFRAHALPTRSKEQQMRLCSSTGAAALTLLRSKQVSVCAVFSGPSSNASACHRNFTARIVRFEAALKTKAASPQLSWTTIAHQFGYHDQMHLVHDFKQLSGEAPTSILDHAQAVLAPQIASACATDTNLWRSNRNTAQTWRKFTRAGDRRASILG